MRSNVIIVLCVVLSCGFAYGQSGGNVVVAQDGVVPDVPDLPEVFTVETSIQAAINQAPERILVFPATYNESITIGEGVEITAYAGPQLTVIDATGLSTAPVVTVESTATNVVFTGFGITGGATGIHVLDGAQAAIRNCVVYNNAGVGILAQWDVTLNRTDIVVQNCTVALNSDDGIQLRGDGRCCGGAGAFESRILNNIVVDNAGFGISFTDPGGGSLGSINEPELMTIEFNNLSGNDSGLYDTTLTNSGIPGPGEISATPRFINSGSGPGFDARLQADSPSIDAGREGRLYIDPDGSRNDQGAHGGPHAENFFEDPQDGPIVRDVSVTPGSVVAGQPITIEATVAVR